VSTLIGRLPLLLGSLDDPIGRWEERAIWTAGILLLAVVLWFVMAPGYVLPRLMRSERKLVGVRVIFQLGLGFFLVRGAAILLDAATNFRGAGGILSRWDWLRDGWFHGDTGWWVTQNQDQWWFHYPLLAIASIALAYSTICHKQILEHWRSGVREHWDGLCQSCRYEVGPSMAICPECGKPVPPPNPAAVISSTRTRVIPSTGKG